MPRRQMERFTCLRPCLRKPCPWCEQCRQLPLPMVSLRLRKIIKPPLIIINAVEFARCLAVQPDKPTPAPRPPTGRSSPRRRARSPQPRGSSPTSKKVEISNAAFKGDLAAEKKKGQIKDKIILGGTEGSNEDRDGKHAKE